MCPQSIETERQAAGKVRRVEYLVRISANTRGHAVVDLFFQRSLPRSHGSVVHGQPVVVTGKFQLFIGQRRIPFQTFRAKENFKSGLNVDLQFIAVGFTGGGDIFYVKAEYGFPVSGQGGAQVAYPERLFLFRVQMK